jgi:UDP-N-acetylmuramate--alanine ligase
VNYPVPQGGTITLVDDYGHHPREIAATVQAARESWPDRRLAMVYQPHRYTRTRDLFTDFTQVLSTVDKLFLLDVYAAGEKPILGADGASLSDAVTRHGKIHPIFVERHEALPGLLVHELKDGDVLLMQGAGNIGGIAARLAEHGLMNVVASTKG